MSSQPGRRSRSPLSVGWVARRILAGAISVWGVVSILWLALQLSGAPLALFVQQDATPEELERATELLGYNEPILQRYLTFMASVLTGSFPDSLQYQQSPMEIIIARLPSTVQLAAVALLIGGLLGLVLGYLSVFGRALIRSAISAAVSSLQAIPTFVLCVLLVLFLSIRTNWLPASGADSPAGIVNPALALGIGVAVPIARVFRASLEDQSQAEFVVAARATGRSERQVRRLHVVPNALLPVVSVFGVEIGHLLAGTVIVESIFRWPGVGGVMMTAVTNQDYPLILASVVWTAIAFVVVGSVVDLIYALVDPRVVLET